MDEAIKEFKNHLNSHPRTILSARFGDGKSFFLSEVEKHWKRSFVFLKIYPVNYQVADNQDIFEYIKRDLLFQLYYQEMVPESYEIPDGIASYFFLKNNWEAFAEEILQTLSYFDASNTMKAALGAAKFLKAMKTKYDAFKKNGGEIGARLDRFITSFDEKGIYEEDPITSILCDIIKGWKKQYPGRRVCLVFEDMDRIDPAHIFRILNVISAHMDYGYKYGGSPKSNSTAGNKFGVDNIIVCLDFDNLKRIFHHFYGQKTCFDGYINKFSDKGIFQYSLKEQTQKYYQEELVRVTGMDSKAVSAMMEQIDLSPYTLRQIYHALDGIEKQIWLPFPDGEIVPHRGLYTIAAFLRRLGLSDGEIIRVISNVFRAHPEIVGIYVATTMRLRRGKEYTSPFFTFGEIDSGYLVRYEVMGFKPNGTASFTRHLFGPYRSDSNYQKQEEEIEFILKHVHI